MNLLDLLKKCEKEKVIKIYLGKEIIADPYDKTVEVQLQNPIPINAFVYNISPEAIKWKYEGLIPYGSKTLICDKKYLDLIKLAQKIEIDNEFYTTYVNAEKGFEIIIRNDYLLVTLSKKP